MMRKRTQTQETESISIAQPALFDFREASSGMVELFPAVWSALEDLASPAVLPRLSALERLLALKAHRLSPLVVYVLASRLADPDITVRINVIKILADTLSTDSDGAANAENVNRYLIFYLGQLPYHAIEKMLEAVNAAPEIEALAARLLNFSTSAGSFLADYLSERKNSLILRRQAVRLIGLVGYLEAVPALERMEARLASRRQGQQLMPFAPPSAPDEADLLPDLQKTLFQLKYT
jgi:hypothetical protein